MKRKFLVMVALLAMALVAAPAMAVTFTLPAGSTSSGGAVSASADFTIFLDTNPDPGIDNGHIDITLKNLQANVGNIAQCISDLFFDLSTGQTAGSLLTSSGKERTIAANGTYTDGSVGSTGWGLQFTATGFHLNDLGFAGPAHLIIGPPDGSNVYSAANNSIAGNGPHNPLLAETASFSLGIAGLTDETQVQNVVFSFGTTPGDNVNVPIPPTVLLMGSGLLGLGLVGWRRRK